MRDEGRMKDRKHEGILGLKLNWVDGAMAECFFFVSTTLQLNMATRPNGTYSEDFLGANPCG